MTEPVKVTLEMIAAGEQVFRQRFAECCRGAAPAKAVCEAAAIAIYGAMATRPSPEADALRTQIIAQVLWEKIGPAITAPRAADIARDIDAALANTPAQEGE